VRSVAAKEKLVACLSPTNVEKARAAPVTAINRHGREILRSDRETLSPGHQYREYFANDKGLAEATAFRNSSLQGAYFILAARAIGLDCGPMSGFDNAKLDATFLVGPAGSPFHLQHRLR